MRRLTFLGLIVLALAVLTQAEVPARAAFPGINGKIAFTSDRDGNWEVYVMDADGGNQTRLTNNAATDGGPAGPPSWSPDGAMIAFASERDGNFEVYSMNADGTTVRRLTNNPAVDGLPAWSPDGERIAFVSDRDGNPEVYVMNADGSQPQRLTDEPGWDQFPAWSPDGTRIAYQSTRRDPDPSGCVPDCFVDILTMAPDGSNIRQLTSDGASSRPEWSPDGEEIAYSYNDGNAPGVYLMDADGGNQRDATPLTTQFESAPAWSPDGERIAFIGSGQEGFDIFVMGADGSAKARLTSAMGNDTSPDWQPLLLGDVNCRRGANSIDALLVLQLSAELVDALPCGERADVNDDGRVNSLDAQLILQYDAHVIASLPA